MTSEAGGRTLYQQVIQKAAEWGTTEQLMYVIGATHPELLRAVRDTAGDYFFLVPGVGAQGGDLGDVARAAMTEDVGLLVNATRAIIYASKEEDFAEAAAAKAQAYQKEMASFLPNV